MMTHPFIRQGVSPLTRQTPVMKPAAVKPVASHVASPLGQQRTEVALGLAKQRALANALRGGTNTGVPQAAPNPGIVRPQGLPGIR